MSKNKHKQGSERPLQQKLHISEEGDKKDTRKCKDILWTWTGRIYIVEITIVPKAIHKCSAIPISLCSETENRTMLTLFGTAKDPRLPKQSWADRAMV